MNHSIQVEYAWRHVGEVTADDGRLLWPAMPRGAGVYRFTLELDSRSRYYVGETDNYRRRFSHYANPGPTQTTNIKMNARLLHLLTRAGGAARVDIAVNVQLFRDGSPIGSSVLPDVFVRRLLENAALVETAATGGEIINGRGFPPGELSGAQ